MTVLFPELSDDLGEAAERRARPRRIRILPMFGGTLAVVAVAGAATAATGVWRPQIGDERRGTPSISASAVPADQLEIFGVLRRPAGPEDRNAEVRQVLKLIGRGVRGVRTDAVRFLAPASGTSGAQILVPAQRAHGIDDALCLYVVDPADGAGSSCFTTEMVSAGTAVLSTMKQAPYTPTQRRKLAAAMRKATRENRAARRAVRRSLEPLPSDARTRRRLIERAYLKRHLNGMSVDAPRPRILEVDYFGLVPDNVATVTRTTPNGTATAAVRNNLFHLRDRSGAVSRGTTTLKDTQGRTITTAEGF